MVGMIEKVKDVHIPIVLRGRVIICKAGNEEAGKRKSVWLRFMRSHRDAMRPCQDGHPLRSRIGGIAFDVLPWIFLVLHHPFQWPYGLGPRKVEPQDGGQWPEIVSMPAQKAGPKADEIPVTP
jgi:hypothetical protein